MKANSEHMGGITSLATFRLDLKINERTLLRKIDLKLLPILYHYHGLLLTSKYSNVMGIQKELKMHRK
jgi:hypothetical protein